MAHPTSRPKIAFVVTIPGAARAFLQGPLVTLADTFDIALISNFADDPADDLAALVSENRLRLVSIPFARKPSLLADVRSWWYLFRRLRGYQPAVVISLMPKTGLLAMTAALVAGCSKRAHMFTGQVWATRTGWQRMALKAIDRLIAGAATNVLADSPSQRDFLISNRIARHIEVLGHGSVSGVNTLRFRPDEQIRGAVRNELGLAEDALIFGFLGRINRDKGVLDLVAAFATADLPRHVVLVLVGPDEERLTDQIRSTWPDLESTLHIVGPTSSPERWLASFDVCCLPSYREGFGTTILEAAACGVPALASRIYGLTDAIEEGQTGLLHPPGDVTAIAEGLQKLSADNALRTALGIAARIRAQRDFSQESMNMEWLAFVRQALMPSLGASSQGPSRVET